MLLRKLPPISLEEYHARQENLFHLMESGKYLLAFPVVVYL
jgi:hypothetical protein